MNLAVAPPGRPLSTEQLDALLFHLDHMTENRSDPQIGVQMEFRERNGFDVGAGPIRYFAWLEPAINKFFLPQYMDHFDVPEEEKISREALKSVLLQIRDRIRRTFEMPALTEAEKENWVLDFSLEDRPWEMHLHQRHGEVRYLTYVQITEDEVRQAADYMKAEYPEHVRYFRAWRDLAPVQGYGQWRDDDRFIDVTPAWDAMADSIEAVVWKRLKPGEVGDDYVKEKSATYERFEKFL